MKEGGKARLTCPPGIAYGSRGAGAAVPPDATLTFEVELLKVSHALSDALNLARRYKLSAYDAAYLELALRRGLPLATLDGDLEKAARKAGVKRFESKKP